MKTELKQFIKFNEELKKRVIEKTSDAYDMTLNGIDYRKDDTFGSYQTFYQMHATINVPKTWENPIINIAVDETTDGDNAVNPQMKLFIDQDHVATFDANHHHYPLNQSGEIKIHVEIFTGNSDKKYPVYITISDINPSIQALVYDIDVFTQSLNVIDSHSVFYQRIYRGLQDALRFVDVDADLETLLTQVKKARDHIETLYAINEDSPVLHAVAHTHIDIAWLWTVAQAIDKSERSFTTILNLMKQYPQFKFIQSQPQLYEYIEKRNPKLFNEIKEAVKKGQWEIEGGMWVEADTTLVSGESLVRQFLYGKSYFQKTLWCG